MPVVAVAEEVFACTRVQFWLMSTAHLQIEAATFADETFVCVEKGLFGAVTYFCLLERG